MKEFIDGITIEYIKNKNKCKTGRCLKIRGDRLDFIEEQIEMIKELDTELDCRGLGNYDYDNEEEHYCDDCDNIITIRYNLYDIYNKYI